MPLYEYICQACGERFEKLIRGDARAGDRLPQLRERRNHPRSLDLRDKRQQRCACNPGLRPSWLRHLLARPCAALIHAAEHDQRWVLGSGPDTRRWL